MLSVSVFLDGLNLYHGMRSAHLLDYRWLDLHVFAERLVRAAEIEADPPFIEQLVLQDVTYCTSMVTDKQARRRQDLFLQAIAAHRPDILILMGKYEEKGRDCDCHCGCHNQVMFQKEKRTDVNLAVEMLKAAVATVNRPDVILLVTGDADLVPAIEAVQAYGLPVVVAAPPARGLAHLHQEADVYFRVARDHLRYAPLPSVVMGGPDGQYPIMPPDGWKDPADW